MIEDSQAKLILSILRKEFPELQLVYLFGSEAQEQASETSDIDIAVFCGKPIDNIVRWDVSQEIALKLSKDVDLVDLASCSTVMRFQVVSTGMLLFDKNSFAPNFENVSISMYQHLSESRLLIINDLVERLTDG